MKTTYSKLNLILNNSLNEKICIGLVMFSSKQTILKYSLEKLTLLKGLISKEKYFFTKKYLTALENDFLNEDNPLNISLEKKYLSEDYISYLSIYSNNTIQFTKLQTIDIELNTETLKALFEKFVFEYRETKVKKKKVNIFKRVQQKLYPQIETKVNIDVKLSNKEIQSLITPIDIDFIGINGLPVTGQIIDFKKSFHYLNNDITQYIALADALDRENSKEGKYFLIGKEPNKKKDPKNHNIWNNVRKSSFMDFVEINETEKIENYLEEKDVKPFFEV